MHQWWIGTFSWNNTYWYEAKKKYHFEYLFNLNQRICALYNIPVDPDHDQLLWQFSWDKFTKKVQLLFSLLLLVFSFQSCMWGVHVWPHRLWCVCDDINLCTSLFQGSCHNVGLPASNKVEYVETCYWILDPGLKFWLGWCSILYQRLLSCNLCEHSIFLLYLRNFVGHEKVYTAN